MRILAKLLKWFLAVIVVLAVIFFIGPKVEAPNMDKSIPSMDISLSELEMAINKKEQENNKIKPDNEARIIWYDSISQKTKYSIVYLHGWSASQEEGDPIHIATAKRYGCNLYLPRLAGHGLKEDEPMLDLTADQVIESAKEAIAVGKKLGDKVILMGTSTGGTLALHLAGGNTDIAALLLYSPNIEIFDPSAKLLSGPWGVQLAKTVKGSDYHEFDTNIELKNKYWTTKYRLEALTHLQAMVDETMTTETFAAVDQPVFLGYYYKDEVHQDSVVSVPALLKMYEELGTPTNKKKKIAFPNVGDHVMTSYISSKDLESVKQETNDFLEEVVGLKE